MTSDHESRFFAKAGLSGEPSLGDLVEAVRAIPYGRPDRRTPEAVVDEWKGTCSTKHALLAELLATRPELHLELIHRVYRVTRDEARARFGAPAAAAVPEEGLTDVHTYATVMVHGRRVRVDVTFPGPRWDGRSDMPLWCGEGVDHPAGDDPWTMKDLLVKQHCDPSAREHFIAALST